MGKTNTERFFSFCKYFLRSTLFILLFVPCESQSAELNRSVINSQPKNKSETCYIRLPPRTVNVPYKFTVEWDGSCVNGFAEGNGSIIAHHDGKLNSREIVTLEKGYRSGRGITANLMKNDVGYGGVVITNWRDGYVCGTMEEYDRSGKRMGAGEGDCAGNVHQTSNPWDYFLQQVPGPDWKMRLLYKFLFNQDGRYQANYGYCKQQFLSQGLSDSVADTWCSLNF